MDDRWTTVATIATARGTVNADFTVLTRGGYLEGLRTIADWRVMPVGTYVVSTEPLGEFPQRLLREGALAVPLRGEGRQALAREVAHGVADHYLFLREQHR